MVANKYVRLLDWDELDELLKYREDANGKELETSYVADTGSDPGGVSV
jgi:hypothetical protein